MKYLIGFFALFLTLNVSAQLNGVVFGSDTKKREKIVGAKLYFKNAKMGVRTDEEGKFKVILPKNLPDTMIVSAMGYFNDTVIVDKKDRFSAMDITLYSSHLLPEVVVEARKSTNSILKLKVLHIEQIDAGELRKAACCNLSESFETNASVDVNITDAVSGAKKIEMMGLNGVYTQLQLENIPFLRGLESSLGLTSLSGTWIESIQITKGTGNVVNGYESMAGLVNMEVKKPREMEKIYLNGYINRFGRAEINFNSGFRLNKKWTSGWLIHASTNPLEIDENKDGFRDMPIGQNVGVMNRYDYRGKKMEAQLGVNFYWDHKKGGQLSEISNPFQVDINARHIDVFAKTGFFMKKPLHSLGFVYNLKYQALDAKFGLRKYTGTEKRGYFNMIYDGIFGNSSHKFKTGASFVYVDYLQSLNSNRYDFMELVPGAFFEYTYTGARVSAVLGVRGDYHNTFGVQGIPRAHFKFILSEYTDLRITGGKGWRTPNYMVDNISLLANSKAWVLQADFQPEISWNYGGSIVQRFKMMKQKGSIAVDFYQTRFVNQLIVDRDQSFNAIVFDNLNGESVSNSLQAEVKLPFGKQFEMKLAYKWLDVKADFGGQKRQKIMVPEHRGMINLSYKTRNKKWEFDITGTFFGEARLPTMQLPDGTLTQNEKSKPYPILNAQVTYKIKKWDIYLGGENLTNSIQKNPIIDAKNPFSTTFDATRVWAPIYGMNIYVGFRFSIKQKEEE